MNTGRAPIAVDLGATSIKMLQLQGRGSQLSVGASGLFILPQNLPTEGPERRAVLVDGIQRLLASAPFNGKQCVSCLSDGVLQYKNVRMPSMPTDELAQAVRWEAQDRFQLAEQDRVEFLEAGNVREGEEMREEVILMAAGDEALREHLEVLTQAGLKPAAIEPAPVALARCFGRFVRRDSDQTLARVIVDIGGSGTKVLILRGRTVAFYKPIDIGGRHFDEAVASHLELPLDEAADLRRKLSARTDSEDQSDSQLIGATRRENVHRAIHESVRPVMNELASEIGLCLRYYSVTFRGSRPGRIELVGGESSHPQLAQSISEQLQLEVMPAQPLEGIDLSGEHVTIERRETQGLWAAALGMAMRPMSVATRKRGAA